MSVAVSVTGEIVVGVGGPLRLQHEAAPAEIESRAVLHGKRRQDDLDSLECLIPKHRLVDGKITLGA